jgi:hypothetical protein
MLLHFCKLYTDNSTFIINNICSVFVRPDLVLLKDRHLKQETNFGEEEEEEEKKKKCSLHRQILHMLASWRYTKDCFVIQFINVKHVDKI